jgi:spermidine synthase
MPKEHLQNREHLGHLAGHPLSDHRVRVFEADVADIINKSSGFYDAVLLDVDNGPEGLTRKDNDKLYSEQGLVAAKHALKPSGILAVWSSSPNQAFTKRLEKVGFKVDVRQVHARKSKKGGRHTIWFASK